MSWRLQKYTVWHTLKRMLNTIEGEEGGGCLLKGIPGILSPAYGICLLWSSKHFSFSDLAIFWISKPENLCISIHQLHVMHYIVTLDEFPSFVHICGPYSFVGTILYSVYLPIRMGSELVCRPREEWVWLFSLVPRPVSSEGQLSLQLLTLILL